MTECAVQCLPEEEDIIIDGETEIDDFAIAARIAQIENQEIQKYFTATRSETAEKTAAARSSYYLRSNLDDGSSSPCSEDDAPCPPAVEGPTPADWKPATPCLSTDAPETPINAKPLPASPTNVKRKNPKESNIQFPSSDAEAALSEDDGAACDVDTQSREEANAMLNSGNWSIIQPVEVPDLPSTVPPELPVAAVGVVHAVVDSMIVVKSKGTDVQPLDLGSILCLNDRTVLGPISDTFGHVSCPLYVVCVRDDKRQSLPEEGAEVFCDLHHSTFLFGANGEVPVYLKSCKDSYIEGDDVDSSDSNEE